MPSHQHETLLEMFRHRPALAAELLTEQLGIRVPDHVDARLGAAEVAELRPAEHRADAVVVLRDGDRAVFAVVVEIQLRRNEDKRWAWPEYVVGVRRRLRCPTALLVLCPDSATAGWAGEPIDLDEAGSVVRAQVFGPDSVPVLVDPVEAARSPELAVLSALAHVGDDGPFALLDALTVALDRIEVDHAVEYARLVLTTLPGRARAHLEELMATETYEYESEFTRRLEARGEARGEVRGEVRGEAQGRVSMLLRILTRRGIEIPADVRDRITACTDLDQLDTWGDRAGTAETIADVIA